MTLRKSILFIAGTIAFWGASALFTPDARAAQCRIEPLGDSITAGVGSTPINPGYLRGTGYRNVLGAFPPVVDLKLVGARDDTVPETIPTAGYGPVTDYGAGPWAFRFHSGVPGWTTWELAQVVGAGYALKPTGTGAPHIVLVHAGTNDFIQNSDAATVAGRLSTLLNNVKNKYPNAKIIVAKIIPINPTNIEAYKNPTINAYNSAIPGIVASLNGAAPPRFSWVDMYSNFIVSNPLANLYADAYHPNNAGYFVMGSLWSAAIKAIATSAGCTPTP